MSLAAACSTRAHVEVIKPRVNPKLAYFALIEIKQQLLFSVMIWFALKKYQLTVLSHC
jgi:hypothetical protein